MNFGLSKFKLIKKKLISNSFLMRLTPAILIPLHKINTFPGIVCAIITLVLQIDFEA